MSYATRTNAFLVSINQAINSSSNNGKAIEIPITIVVAGQLISGFVVSEEEYFSHELTTAWKEAYDSVIKKPRDDFFNVPEEDFDIDKVPDHLKQQFLFLKNAYYLNGDKSIPSIGNNGIPIQVRVADISAFNFGSMSMEQK